MRRTLQEIRLEVLGLAAMESRVEVMRREAEPKGQQYGTGHSSGHGDASAKVLRYLQAEEELQAKRVRINRKIDSALHVLYGVDGQGGLAKARDSVSADILCAYYLQGQSWHDVAQELASEDSTAPVAWCKMRARRALDFIDRWGAETISHI